MQSDYVMNGNLQGHTPRKNIYQVTGIGLHEDLHDLSGSPALSVHETGDPGLEDGSILGFYFPGQGERETYMEKIGEDFDLLFGPLLQSLFWGRYRDQLLHNQQISGTKVNYQVNFTLFAVLEALARDMTNDRMGRKSLWFKGR